MKTDKADKADLKTQIIKHLAAKLSVVEQPEDYKVSQWEIDILNAGIKAGQYIIELKMKNNEVVK